MVRTVTLRAAYVLGFLFLATLFSCTVTDPGPTIPDYPIPDSNVAIMANASPQTSASSGKTPNTVYVQFMDNRSGAQPNAFGDAVVTANGIQLNPSSTIKNYFSLYSGLTLGIGDTVTVKIVHSLIGTVTASATVPVGVPGAPNFTLSPLLPGSGTANTASSYTMSWTGNGSEEYSPMVWLYDTNKKSVVGYGFYTTAATYVFSPTYLSDGSSVPYPFLTFSLPAVDKTPLSGFASYSALRVESAYQPPQSNK